MKYISILIIIPLVSQGHSCRSKSFGNGQDAYYATQNPASLWDFYVKHSKGKGYKSNVTDIELTNYQKTMYGKWLKDYMLNRTRLKIEADSRDLRPPAVPFDWIGYGAGEGGQKPPPWAYVQNAYGKPQYCLLSPEPGIPHSFCSDYQPGPQIRYAFNTYSGKCEDFLYTGCGGNQNNFRFKKDCESSCELDAKTNCDEFSSFKEW